MSNDNKSTEVSSANQDNPDQHSLEENVRSHNANSMPADNPQTTAEPTEKPIVKKGSYLRRTGFALTAIAASLIGAQAYSQDINWGNDKKPFKFNLIDHTAGKIYLDSKFVWKKDHFEYVTQPGTNPDHDKWHLDTNRVNITANLTIDSTKHEDTTHAQPIHRPTIKPRDYEKFNPDRGTLRITGRVAAVDLVSRVIAGNNYQLMFDSESEMTYRVLPVTELEKNVEAHINYLSRHSKDPLLKADRRWLDGIRRLGYNKATEKDSTLMYTLENFLNDDQMLNADEVETLSYMVYDSGRKSLAVGVEAVNEKGEYVPAVLLITGKAPETRSVVIKPAPTKPTPEACPVPEEKSSTGLYIAAGVLNDHDINKNIPRVGIGVNSDHFAAGLNFGYLNPYTDNVSKTDPSVNGGFTRVDSKIDKYRQYFGIETLAGFENIKLGMTADFVKSWEQKTPTFVLQRAIDLLGNSRDKIGKLPQGTSSNNNELIFGVEAMASYKNLGIKGGLYFNPDSHNRALGVDIFYKFNTGSK